MQKDDFFWERLVKSMKNICNYFFQAHTLTLNSLSVNLLSTCTIRSSLSSPILRVIRLLVILTVAELTVPEKNNPDMSVLLNSTS